MGKPKLDWNPQLTREAFQDNYAKNRGRPWNELGLLAIPCNCQAPGCLGWAAWPLKLLRSVIQLQCHDVASLCRVLYCPDPALVKKLVLYLGTEEVRGPEEGSWEKDRTRGGRS
jgi:hypothetical protein